MICQIPHFNRSYNLKHSSTTFKQPNLRVLLEEHVLRVNMVSDLDFVYVVCSI